MQRAGDCKAHGGGGCAQRAEIAEPTAAEVAQCSEPVVEASAEEEPEPFCERRAGRAAQGVQGLCGGEARL